jgi:hypothetical protein
MSDRHALPQPDGGPVTSCGHDDGEQHYITTYGDLGNGIRRWLCGSCSAVYTEPTAEAVDARRREADAMFAEHPDLMGGTSD